MRFDRYTAQAREDFGRARVKQTFGRLLSLLRHERDQLLSLQEVRALLRPTRETYRGLQTVPIARIVGSEGRYQDFDRTFLPRHDHLKGRWVRVDAAHHQQLILPPVTLYEIGGVYFVRDGNHRVSVGRLQGVEFIDAEVISLASRLRLSPEMSVERLRAAVIDLEKREFFRQTRLDRYRPSVRLDFSVTGRYDEIIRHINGHKYYLNLSQKDEIPFKDAMLSWHDVVYAPIVRIIEAEGLASRFPGRTPADLYVWIVRHWDELKRRFGQGFPLREAARDFARQHGRRSSGPLARLRRLPSRLRGLRVRLRGLLLPWTLRRRGGGARNPDGAGTGPGAATAG